MLCPEVDESISIIFLFESLGLGSERRNEFGGNGLFTGGKPGCMSRTNTSSRHKKPFCTDDEKKEEGTGAL